MMGEGGMAGALTARKLKPFETSATSRSYADVAAAYRAALTVTPMRDNPFSPPEYAALDAFEATKSLSNNSIVANFSTTEDRENIVKLKEMPLETGDAIYFLLTLACSANIGSALTYTGLSSCP